MLFFYFVFVWVTTDVFFYFVFVWVTTDTAPLCGFTIHKYCNQFRFIFKLGIHLLLCCDYLEQEVYYYYLTYDCTSCCHIIYINAFLDKMKFQLYTEAYLELFNYII